MMKDISNELLGAEKVISSIYLVNTMDKATYLSAAAVVVLLAMSVTLSTIAQQQQQQPRTNGQTTTTSTQIVNFTQLFKQKICILSRCSSCVGSISKPYNSNSSRTCKDIEYKNCISK